MLSPRRVPYSERVTVNPLFGSPVKSTRILKKREELLRKDDVRACILKDKDLPLIVSLS